MSAPASARATAIACPRPLPGPVTRRPCLRGRTDRASGPTHLLLEGNALLTAGSLAVNLFDSLVAAGPHSTPNGDEEVHERTLGLERANVHTHADQVAGQVMRYIEPVGLMSAVKACRASSAFLRSFGRRPPDGVEGDSRSHRQGRALGRQRPRRGPPSRLRSNRFRGLSTARSWLAVTTRPRVIEVRR